MDVIPYNAAYSEQWDKFVLNHEYSWPGHHSGLFYLEKELGGENYSSILLDEKKNLVGIMPLFLHERRIKQFFKFKTLISGSSLRSGPLFSTELTQKQQTKALDILMSHILKRAKYLKADSIKISYPVMHGNKTSLERYGYLPLRKYGFREQNTVTMIKDLRFQEEDLFNSLDRMCRKSIRKCIREGGKFVVVKDRSEWMDCYDLNLQTFRDQKTGPYSKKILEIVWDSFVDKGLTEVTGVTFRGKIFSVVATAVLGKSCYPWIGFNSKPYPIRGGNNFLTWSTMLYFKEKGVDFFEIGSREFIGQKQIQISRYKESFNGKDCYCLDGELTLRPFNNSALELMSLIRESLSKHALKSTPWGG